MPLTKKLEFPFSPELLILVSFFHQIQQDSGLLLLVLFSNSSRTLEIPGEAYCSGAV